MSIQQIVQNIKDHGGIQRKSKFSVFFEVECNTDDDGLETKVENKLSSDDLTSFLPPIEVLFGGRKLELMADRLTGPGSGRLIPINPDFTSQYGLMMTFPIEQDFKQFKFFDKWFRHLAVDSQAGAPTFANFYNNCARNGTITVNFLNYNGELACKFIFEEAYPVQITQVELNATPNSGPATYDILFNYRRYVMTPTQEP